MKFTLDVTTTEAGDLDPLHVADDILDYLCDTSDDVIPGVFSFDGCEPERS